MNNNFSELVKNMELSYNTGEKIRIGRCISLARELLLNKDNKLDSESCRLMVQYSPLRLVWMKKDEFQNTKFLAVRYKDIAVEFYSINEADIPIPK